MADLILLSHIFQRGPFWDKAYLPTDWLGIVKSETKEGFATQRRKWTPIAIIILILYCILTIVIGGYAAWLSWEANDLAGYGIFLKVLFAMFAFFFGTTFLVIYLICKFDLVMTIKKAKGLPY